MMGFDSNMMSGGAGGTWAFFGWLLYILIVIVLIFGVIALWKYINEK